MDANAINPRSVSLITESQNAGGSADLRLNDTVRRAVRDWQASLPGRAQETIAQQVADEWQRRGGRGLLLVGSSHNTRQNLFRWIENPRQTEKYARYVALLTPVIAAVMPLEIARAHGLKTGQTQNELVASAVKECGEAHQAGLLGAPLRELEREIYEGIQSLVRLAPPERWGAVLTSAAAMLNSCI